DLEYKPKETTVIEVDSVGAGVGEIVIVAQGSSARQTTFTKNKPVDAVIMAIVDKLDISVKDKQKESVVV
ncbi:MAG: EutN/CcmL family microcompartment protein, partial [Bacteroidota bacterium]